MSQTEQRTYKDMMISVLGTHFLCNPELLGHSQNLPRMTQKQSLKSRKTRRLKESSEESRRNPASAEKG